MIYMIGWCPVTKRKEHFAQLPASVVCSKAYMTAPGRACALLSFFAQKYTGHNNGDLSVTYAELHKEFGWHNKTVTLALNYLRQQGFLIRIRKGRAIGSVDGKPICSLYALAWINISKPKRQKVRECGYAGSLNLKEIWNRKCVL